MSFWGYLRSYLSYVESAQILKHTKKKWSQVISLKKEKKISCNIQIVYIVTDFWKHIVENVTDEFFLSLAKLFQELEIISSPPPSISSVQLTFSTWLMKIHPGLQNLLVEHYTLWRSFGAIHKITLCRLSEAAFFFLPRYLQHSYCCFKLFCYYYSPALLWNDVEIYVSSPFLLWNINTDILPVWTFFSVFVYSSPYADWWKLGFTPLWPHWDKWFPNFIVTNNHKGLKRVNSAPIFSTVYARAFSFIYYKKGCFFF